MFNETDQPIHLFANPCPAGQVQDYDPETRQFLPGCVDDTTAYQAGGYPTGPNKAAVTPGSNTWLWVTLGGLVLLAFATGRR